METTKYIIGESSTKKTRKMFEQAKESGAIVVCKYPLHMQEKANAYGIYNLKFIGYEDLDEGVIEEGKIAIDELGNFFKHRFGVNLDSFTMTVD